MSLNGSLQIGYSALRASQAALQITGNNVSNASSADYTRQRAVITPSSVGSGVGSGVNFSGIERVVDESINRRMRSALSDQAAAQTASNQLTQVETILNGLGDDTIGSRLTSFFNAFSALANDPQSSSQRTMVLQAGASVASAITQVYKSLQSQRTGIDAQVQSLVGEVNRLLGQVSSLNTEVTAAEASGATGSAAALRDQRDSALRQLGQLVNADTQTSSNGTINIFIGSTPLVLGSETFELDAQPDPDDPRGGMVAMFVGTTNKAPITGGELGGLLSARTQTLDAVQDGLDSLADALITEVNRAHSEGQSLESANSFTSANRVLNPAVALNAAGLPTTPVNGTFNLRVTNSSGQETVYTVEVDLDGLGADDSLNAVVSQIDALAGVSAVVTADGRATLRGDNGNTISFAEDSSGLLAALGINTFFSGTSAADIAVRADLTPSRIAAAMNNMPGDGSNALRLAGLADQVIAAMDGRTLGEQYNELVANVASQSANASAYADTADAMAEALTGQRDAISGVSLDEESILLIEYQRAYQGAAQYISMVNELMGELFNLI